MATTVEEPPAPESARRTRTALLIGGVAAVVVAGTVAAVALSGNRGGTGLTGAPAPAFTLARLTGDGTVSLASAGGRPLVLNFWASWCIPCQQEMPAFEAEHRKLGERVAFLGIDTKDAHDDGVAFLQKVGVDYPAGYDAPGAVADRYGLIGMPTTILVRPDGRIAYRHTGELSEGGLDDLIRRYLG